jgi:hypothetical protein
MTWYADEVIARATPEAVRTFVSDALLAPFSYHLANPLEHPWHTPELVHGLPPEGLLVVRPVCDATSDADPAEWYGEACLDWQSFSGRTDEPLQIDRERVAKECSMSVEDLPPHSLLQQLKSLAATSGTTVLFYSCFMWGGDVEREYAWIFERSETALVGVPPGAPGERRSVAAFEDSKPMRVRSGDVLMEALKHLSLELPTPYFAPHTRSFPWVRYKLLREPA